jgi:hypothetical protein
MGVHLHRNPHTFSTFPLQPVLTFDGSQASLVIAGLSFTDNSRSEGSMAWSAGTATYKDTTFNISLQLLLMMLIATLSGSLPILPKQFQARCSIPDDRH